MWWLLYGFFFALGFLLAYFGLQHYNKTQNLLLDGVKTTAVVTDLLVNQDTDGDTYIPVFEFKDRTNTIRNYKSPIASSPPAYQVGEKVKIIYDKKDTNNVKTISFWGLYRFSIILWMIAAPLLIIGGSYLLYSLR